RTSAASAIARASVTASSARPGVVPDVSAQVLAFELDEVGGAVGALGGLVDVGADRGDGEDASARRQQPIAVTARASVADRDAFDGRGGFDATDLAARLVGP